MRTLSLLSVDEILLSRYMNWSTNVRGWVFNALIKIRELCFIWIHKEAIASCGLLLINQLRSDLGRCICKKCQLICVVWINNSFWEILFASCFWNWLVGKFFLQRINPFRVIWRRIKFQTSLIFVYQQLNVKRFQIDVKTVLCQTIQFSISTQFSSIWPIDRTLSDATTPGQGGPESYGNEWVLRIPQGSCITGIHHHVFSVINRTLVTPLQRSSRCILPHQPTGQLPLRDVLFNEKRIYFIHIFIIPKAKFILLIFNLNTCL